MQTRFKGRVACGAVAVAAMLAAGVAQAVGVSGQGDWETTLQPRDLDGNAANGPEAFYDTALNITWLRNANAHGFSDWPSANTWANSLVVGGVGGWRLPTLSVVDPPLPACNYGNSGTDCGYNVRTATSEMAHLWYVALGNKAYCDTAGLCPQPGWGLSNTGSFQNLFAFHYWSGLQLAGFGSNIWYLDFNSGEQISQHWTSSLTLALAVHPGDVAAAIPEPQTYALMLMGLSALVLAPRRRPG